MELSRRLFFKSTAAGGLALYVYGANGMPEAVGAEIPGGSLPATNIRQFVNRLTVPQILPRRGTRSTPYGTADYYEMSMKQTTQQMRPTGMPRTTLWAYGPTGGSDSAFTSPGLSIAAQQNRPVQIKWTNELVDRNGRYLPHLFAVDRSLHWANVPQEPGHEGLVSTDIKPALEGRRYVTPDKYTDPETQYTDYTGPVPIVTHLHGALAVKDHSDGYSEAWYLPRANNIPAGHAKFGRWWDFLKEKHRRETGVDWGEGHQTVTYPNTNRATSLWFHDHALGLTRLTVYAGAASFYLMRGLEYDVLDSRTGRTARAPAGPSNVYGQNPSNPGADLALAIQDRSFNSDGSLFYPSSRSYFDGYEGPFYPEEPGIPPNWVPEFFGNTMVVNGQTWPYQRVERRRYRLRFLNACGSRTLYLDFRGIPGVEVWQVANDGGYLDEKVNVMQLEGWRRGRVILAPAERNELLVDFTNVRTGRYTLRNVGPDAFFPGGRPAENGEEPRVKLYPFEERDVVFPPADPNTTGKVMAFDVVPYWGIDTSTPGRYLRMKPQPKLPAPVRTRRLATTMSFHNVNEDPAPYASHTMLGVLHGEPGGKMHIQDTMWSDPVTENPQPGDVEDWEIYNLVQDAPVPHPIHIHETAFEILERRMIWYHWDTGVMEMGPRTPLLPGETGRKDTVFVYPGEMIRLRMRFTTPGQYMWHCHLLEHEDNEMMRPFRVGPEQPGQPEDLPSHGMPHAH